MKFIFTQTHKILFLILLIFFTDCSESKKEITLKIMSYNVRHGVSMNWEPAMEMQAEIISDQNPQWIGLQEIDNKCKRSGFVDQPKKYSELTNTTGYFGSFMDFDSGQYGMAVLSGLKVVDTEILKLPAGAEPRVSIIQTIEIAKDINIVLANVHFDWTEPGLRTSQAETLLKRLIDIGLPTIVLGDYNAEPESPTINLFEKYGFKAIEKSENNFTWEANNPTVEIDHVYYRSTEKVQIIPVSIEVLNEPEASDHRPVVAEIKLIKK